MQTCVWLRFWMLAKSFRQLPHIHSQVIRWLSYQWNLELKIQKFCLRFLVLSLYMWVWQRLQWNILKVSFVNLGWAVVHSAFNHQIHTTWSSVIAMQYANEISGAWYLLMCSWKVCKFAEMSLYGSFTHKVNYYALSFCSNQCYTARPFLEIT